jgi:hypothetical protein
MLEKLLPWSDETDRVSVESLTGEEMELVIDHLDTIGEEPTQANIEAHADEVLNSDETMVSPFETAEERGRLDKDMVAVDTITEKQDHHIRDNKYSRVLTVASMPRTVSPGWLVPLTLHKENARLSFHIKPRESQSMKDKLQKRLTQMKSAIMFKQERGRSDVYEEQEEKADLERVLRQLIEGTTKLFDVSFYIEIVADSKDELEEATTEVTRDAAKQGLNLHPIENRQVDAIEAVMPLGSDPIHNSNTMQLEALATMFNMVESTIDQSGGVILGWDDNGRPARVNRYGMAGHSKAVSGAVGSGKTFSHNLSLLYQLYYGKPMEILMFDPLGDDFVQFTEALGGKVIKFTDETTINPLAISATGEADTDENPLMTNIRSVLSLLDTYFATYTDGGLSSEQRGTLKIAIVYAYLKYGITKDPVTWDNTNPILDDVDEGLKILAHGGLESVDDISESGTKQMRAIADGGNLTEETRHNLDRLRNPPSRFQEIAERLRPKFESFKPGGVNANLNGRTNISLEGTDFVCFDMSQFADTGKMPLIMHAMLNWAYDKARQNPDKITDITFEESHYLLEREGARYLINLLMRHHRHFRTGITLITQTAEEFLKDEGPREIYDNCNTKQLFHQENVSDEVVNYFGLNSLECDFIEEAAQGDDDETDYSECLLHTTKHGRHRLEVVVSPKEKQFIDGELEYKSGDLVEVAQ